MTEVRTIFRGNHQHLFSYLLHFLLLPGNNNEGANFGWSLGAPAAVPYPMNPNMPMPPPSPQYDDSEPGVDEVYEVKDAGALSFAHYIVKWVN